MARPSGVEQRSARSSVILGSTCDWAKNECPARSAAIVFTHGMPWFRCSDRSTSFVPRALLKPRPVSAIRRFVAFGSFSAYAVVAVHGNGSAAPIDVVTGP